jgi:hypothetical protein
VAVVNDCSDVSPLFRRQAYYRRQHLSRHGNTAEGIPRIEQGIKDFRKTGSVLGLPNHLALLAEALHLADRTPEALEAEVLQLCSYPVIGWLDAPFGFFGLRPIQVATI